MDLLLDDYQTLMVDTFRRFFERAASAHVVRSAHQTESLDPSLWRAFVDLGGTDLSSPDESGSTQGSLIDAALVAMESGRRVVPIPYSEVVTARRVIGRCTTTTPELDPEEVTVYTPAAQGVRWLDGGLVGQVDLVRGAGVSRYALIPTGGVAVVDLARSDVEVVRQPSLGGMALATIHLRGTLPVHSLEPKQNTLTQAVADLRVLRAAELVGAANQAIELALNHTKQRRQFNRPIASFQAVQHRLVDCRTAVDAAELLVLRAASYQDDTDACLYYSAAALLQARAASERAATESLQFHGGYGYTVEQDVHLYLRFVKELGVLAKDPELLRDALPRRARALV